MRKIILTHQKNIRDLGGLVGYKGKKVKSGRIYRGGFLGRVTPEDVEVINSLHLTDIVDFRSTTEFINRPDYPFEGVTFHNYVAMINDIKKSNNKTEDSNLLWFIEEGDNGFEHMYKIYPKICVDPAGIEAFRKFYALLVSKEDGVFYFHCSQGKDRAGLAAYFLEMALGVSKEDALEDYLLTNEAMEIRIKNLKEQVKNQPYYNERYEKSLEEVFSVDARYLNHALEVIEETYGSMDNYLVNVLKIDIEKLRKIYLE